MPRLPSPSTSARAAAFLAPIASVALGACSGPNVASKLAEAPAFQPRDQAKCGVTKSQAEPLIVEWPDAARGKLESMLKRGVVAVRYAGCEMEVLGQCSAKGQYRYSSINPKKSLVKMRDADDLYTNIPAYAVKFESVLQKAGELNVSMTIVGRYETDEKRFELAELEGQCEGATHVVNGLTVGAFDFYAGADAEVGGSVQAGNAGIGAKSTAKRETLNQDGSAEACAKAKREDTVPPYGCGALIRVEVIPIHGAVAARPADATATGDAPPLEPAEPAPLPHAPSAAVSRDADGDGIDDAHDKCPNDPEDKDGFQDDDGCPDPDNDGDGVPDAQDACPNEPGPASTTVIKNGCPVPAVSVSSSSIRILEQIDFDTARSTIKAASASALDRIADVLKSHPEIHLLEISAHSDSTGAHDANLRLTQGRADAVKAALVARGIDPGRLSAKGYGPDMPIADNRTAEGRAQNRRVEFKVAR